MRTTPQPARAALAAATIGLAGTLVGVSTQRPAVAAPVTGAPVSVAVCQATNLKGLPVQRLYLGYENHQSVPADIIRFFIDFGRGNKPESFTETGTFSQGARINHAINLAAHSYQMTPATPTCTVVYVHFTDGTSWTLERRQAALDHGVGERTLTASVNHAGASM